MNTIESNSDCYGKDLLFVALLAFCVITFEPIMIKTCIAPQNDHLNFSFVKDIYVVQEMVVKQTLRAVAHFGHQTLHLLALEL